MPDADPITPCPTCGRHFATSRAARNHHRRVHNVSLTDVPVGDWESHLDQLDHDLANPEGERRVDRDRADRHPLYE